MTPGTSSGINQIPVPPLPTPAGLLPDPATTQGRTEPIVAERSNPTLAQRVGIGTLFAVLLVGMSVLTVFRYTAAYLQADGVQQSVMSVQNVDLFFWGQNRFAAVVSFLASPFADPDVNLVVCLLINALCFHGLLLVIASMGVRLLGGERGWLATLVVFLLLAATAHTVVAPGSIHIMALESQPYSMSWLLTLSAFLLWKRRPWWTFALAVAMVGVAMGLNPSVVLVAAFLAAVEMVRRRQWIRWPAFGAVWVVWFAIWQMLSEWFGGNAGPIPEPEQTYFAFSPTLFIQEFPRSVGTIVAVFSPTRLVVLMAVACLCALTLNRARRADLLPRFALVMLFAVGYFTLFAGNPWVASNGYMFRYFYPVVLAFVVILAAPIGAALLGVRVPAAQPFVRPAIAAGAAVACAASLAGPLIPPSQAPVLQQVQATADFARENDIHFMSGYYWDMWPLLHRTLVDGRTSAFVTGYKSGGDPAAYLARFDEDLASGSPPRAICVNESIDYCATYLDYWTRPGWGEVPGEGCPIPGPTPQLGSPPERVCRILEYTG